uniref:C-X-C motif chemokine 10-like n=1 Tax=Haplochromis burtoni TaxID=8153 RepID=A0A3Q2VSR0_HAPBU
MNSVTAFIACLLILGAQGQPASKSNKCKCYSYIGRISPKLIKAEPVIHYPSIFCPHTEIIVTTKADMKRCVSPESPLGRHILKNPLFKAPKALYNATIHSLSHSYTGGGSYSRSHSYPGAD